VFEGRSGVLDVLVADLVLTLVVGEPCLCDEDPRAFLTEFPVREDRVQRTEDLGIVPHELDELQTA